MMHTKENTGRAAPFRLPYGGLSWFSPLVGLWVGMLLPSLLDWLAWFWFFESASNYLSALSVSVFRMGLLAWLWHRAWQKENPAAEAFKTGAVVRVLFLYWLVFTPDTYPVRMVLETLVFTGLTLFFDVMLLHSLHALRNHSARDTGARALGTVLTWGFLASAGLQLGLSLWRKEGSPQFTNAVLWAGSFGLALLHGLSWNSLHRVQAGLVAGVRVVSGPGGEAAGLPVLLTPQHSEPLVTLVREESFGEGPFRGGSSLVPLARLPERSALAQAKERAIGWAIVAGALLLWSLFDAQIQWFFW